jgi:puromycin-sensitive aminopeptidase
MDQRTMQVTIPDVGENDWVKLNPGTVGYYRVRYTPEVLSQLIPAIQGKTLPPLDRLGILDDTFALVQAGQTSTVEILRLLQAYVDEDNYSVWASVSNIMGKLNVLFGNTDSHDAFKAFGRRLFARIEEKVGWDAKENETHLDALLRSLVLNRMISFDNEKTIQDAQARFALHTSGKKTIHADLRSAVYRAVLSAGNEDTYQSMLKLYRESDIMEEKDRIARALGAIKDVALLKKVLEFAVSEEVRSQDTVFVIISVGMSKDGRELAWDFFKDRLEFFKERYIGGQMVSRMVKYVTENFASEEKAKEVETFFTDHPYPGTERTVQQSCESILLNHAWLKRDYEQTKAFLAASTC